MVTTHTLVMIGVGIASVLIGTALGVYLAVCSMIDDTSDVYY